MLSTETGMESCGEIFLCNKVSFYYVYLYGVPKEMILCIYSNYEDHQRSIMEKVSEIFKIHVIYMVASIWFQIWTLHVKILFWLRCHHQRSRYTHLYERAAQKASFKANILRINGNMEIIFLGYTWLTKISRNEAFQDTMAAEILLHFRFLRLPQPAFRGHIGWLWNRKIVYR